MGLSSLHVCMDSSDHWLQDEGGIMESCSSPISGGEMVMTCTTRPSSSSMIGGGGERRLRPPHDQSLKCPRCDSTHTKFCYYNNYSLSQPRYFCKTCRRYWTKGGTLRNIPVGGGCRKNKKVSSKKSNTNNNNDPLLPPNTSSNSQQNHHLQLHHNAGPSSYIINHHHHKDLQLSFPDVQFNSHLSNILGNNNNSNFMESKYGGIGANINGMLENPVIRPIDFIMESKLEGIIGNSSRNFDFFGNGEMGMANVGLGGDHMTMNNHHGHHHHHHGTNFHGLNSTPPPHHHHHSASFGGMSLDGGSNNGVNFMMDSSSSSCQRLMLPYDAGTSEDHNNNNAPIDVKPNPKLLSLEWQQEQGCSDAGKDSFGYGSWSAMMNGYGSSATNPLV